MTTAGHAAGNAPGTLLLMVFLPLITSRLVGTAQAGPVGQGEEVALTSDQVLRRVTAWLDAEEAVQRLQGQRALDGIHEQMDRMALELERIETKMDLKIDRLQEVLIGRDIKEDETSRRHEAGLERVALLLTEFSQQLQRVEADIKGSSDNTNKNIATLGDEIQAFQANAFTGMATIKEMIRQQPVAGDVISECARDVVPTLRRLADGVERLQPVDFGRMGGGHPAESDETLAETGDGAETPGETGSGADTPRETKDGSETPRETGDGAEMPRETSDGAQTPEETAVWPERHEHGTAERPDDGDSELNGSQTSHTENQGIHGLDRHQEEDIHPALRLLDSMGQLELQILYVSDQLNEGIDWLDKRLRKKFGGLREDLATMTASLRKRFIERRDHLEEVAAKILRLQTAAVDGQSGRGPGEEEGVAAPDNVVTALEAAIYDVIDTDLWYMLSTKLDEAVGGQGNLTRQIGQMEHDMHQGFSKLYAQLTKLSFNLVQSVQERSQNPGTSIRAGDGPETTSPLRHTLESISQQLHDIQLQLAQQQAT